MKYSLNFFALAAFIAVLFFSSFSNETKNDKKFLLTAREWSFDNYIIDKNNASGETLLKALEISGHFGFTKLNYKNNGDLVLTTNFADKPTYSIKWKFDDEQNKIVLIDEKSATEYCYDIFSISENELVVGDRKSDIQLIFR